MAYVPYRHSILSRPVRAESKANVERLETEFQEEEQRIAAKAERLASTEERLIKSFYATAAEKRSNWDDTRQEIRRCEQAKRAEREKELARERLWLSQPTQVFVDTQRPYTAQSTTYYLSEEQELEARRKAEREASEQNRAIMLQSRLQQQYERQLEREAIRSSIQSEDAWFNRGAASERWIAPELRVKQRAAIPQQFVPTPPPYHCDSENTTFSQMGDTREQVVQPRRRSVLWDKDSGAAAKNALSHEFYFRAEEAAAQRPATGQSQASSKTIQKPAAQQTGRYPWSWDT